MASKKRIIYGTVAGLLFGIIVCLLVASLGNSSTQNDNGDSSQYTEYWTNGDTQKPSSLLLHIAISTGSSTNYDTAVTNQTGTPQGIGIAKINDLSVFPADGNGISSVMLSLSFTKKVEDSDYTCDKNNNLCTMKKNKQIIVMGNFPDNYDLGAYLVTGNCSNNLYRADGKIYPGPKFVITNITCA